MCDNYQKKIITSHVFKSSLGHTLGHVDDVTGRIYQSFQSSKTSKNSTMILHKSDLYMMIFRKSVLKVTTKLHRINDKRYIQLYCNRWILSLRVNVSTMDFTSRI